MMMKSLLRWMTAAAKSLPFRADLMSKNYRPRVEKLEDRLVPTWTITDLTATTPLALARNLVGPNAAVSNVTFSGVNVAAGLFTETLNTIGFGSGVILSSGRARDVAGPNNSTSISVTNGTGSDPQLDPIITPNIGVDAAYLSFNWVPSGSVIQLSYVFGSEEYAEFAPPNSSNFSDAFALFLNGKNVTFIPGTTTPVSINNVNAVTNSNFYIDNDVQPTGPKDTQMDGYTKVMTAVLFVKPGTTNHIKLTIEDVTNPLYDSWVMIKTGSLQPAPVGVYAPLRWTYNPTTGITSGLFSIANNSSLALPGPLYLVFNPSSLPKGVTILNASRTASGISYITVPGGSIKANSSVLINIQVRNPLNQNLGTFFRGFKFELTNILV